MSHLKDAHVAYVFWSDPNPECSQNFTSSLVWSKKKSIIYVALKNRENSGLDNHMVQRGKSSRSKKKQSLTSFSYIMWRRVQCSLSDPDLEFSKKKFWSKKLKTQNSVSDIHENNVSQIRSLDHKNEKARGQKNFLTKA